MKERKKKKACVFLDIHATWVSIYQLINQVEIIKKLKIWLNR